MIKPIKNSISFEGFKEYQNSVKQGNFNAKTINAASQVKNVQTPAKPQEKVSFKQKVVNILKGFNNVTGTFSGIVRGIKDGIILAGIVGFVGRNIKKAKGNIGKTISGMFSDAGKIIKTIYDHKPISSLITKSPLENLKTLKSVPAKFYNSCLKGNKITSMLVAASFLGAVAIRAIQGKINANRRNANIDHSVNNPH